MYANLYRYARIIAAWRIRVAWLLSMTTDTTAVNFDIIKGGTV